MHIFLLIINRFRNITQLNSPLSDVIRHGSLVLLTQVGNAVRMLNVVRTLPLSVTTAPRSFTNQSLAEISNCKLQNRGEKKPTRDHSNTCIRNLHATRMGTPCRSGVECIKTRPQEKPAGGEGAAFFAQLGESLDRTVRNKRHGSGGLAVADYDGEPARSDCPDSIADVRARRNRTHFEQGRSS